MTDARIASGRPLLRDAFSSARERANEEAPQDEAAESHLAPHNETPSRLSAHTLLQHLERALLSTFGTGVAVAHAIGPHRDRRHGADARDAAAGAGNSGIGAGRNGGQRHEASARVVAEAL